VVKKMMKDGNHKIAAFLTLMVLLTVPSLALANATPPTTVSGRFRPNVPTIVFSNARYTGLAVHLDVYLTGTYDGGDIDGLFTQDFKITFHYDDLEKVAECQVLGPTKLSQWPIPRTYEFSGVRSVTDAIVLGKSGSFTMLFQVTGHGMPVMQSPFGYDLFGTWRIIQGSGDLTNLHGQGTWWHTAETAQLYPFHMYTGQVHIDP
jgi:hypothetical protein